MTFVLTRREFVRRLSLVTAVAPLVRHRARAPIVLRIGVVPGDSRHAASALARQQGVALGVDDAKRAATLFGGTVETITTSAANARSEHLSALVGGDDAVSCSSLAHAAAAADTLYFNTACSSDALRGAGCLDSAYHVIPSDAMYRDALAMARTSGRSTAGSSFTVVAWDPSFVRFGADTLNARFRTRFGTGMTPDAWGAWLAVKILWESALRARSGLPGAIASHLTRDTTQFDGYKGRPLSFRTWDHQLRQPVYVMSSAPDGSLTLAAEEPVARTGDEPSRELLDRLGTGAAKSPCHLPQ
jgi:ABC-type branched-subunit amino acid transport system substrate-binding protein